MSTEKTKKDITKFKTPVFRVSYPVLTEKQMQDAKDSLIKHADATAEDVKNMKYSIDMIFPKDTNLSMFKKALMKVAKEKYGDKKSEKALKALVNSKFKDGDEKDKEGYEDCIYITASNVRAPGVLDRNKEQIPDVGVQLYPGCYAIAVLTAYKYDKFGGGISLSLGSILKWEEGEPLGVAIESAEDEFEDFDVGGDEEDDYDDNEGVFGDDDDEDEEDAA